MAEANAQTKFGAQTGTPTLLIRDSGVLAAAQRPAGRWL
jgi:hypothetical protein